MRWGEIAQINESDEKGDATRNTTEIKIIRSYYKELYVQRIGKSRRNEYISEHLQSTKIESCRHRKPIDQ